MQYLCRKRSKKATRNLQDLSAYLMSNTDFERLIIGGDWNITLQWIDKSGGTSWKSTTARDKLLTMINEFALVDIFRERNQYKKKSYRYESNALKLSSWIDSFLIARHLAKWFERVESKASNAPDHRALRLTISIAQVSRGPGLWKFNNPPCGRWKVSRFNTRKLYCHQWKEHGSKGQTS